LRHFSLLKYASELSQKRPSALEIEEQFVRMGFGVYQNRFFEGGRARKQKWIPIWMAMVWGARV
jgi:hypothetical protein